jgi:hypothetical protein
MTIKVYMNDGSTEEYPNAHIYWEWDESEKGVDSGYRINSMDKKFNSAVAFVYPGECTKIEITSEESNKVIKNKAEVIEKTNRSTLGNAINLAREAHTFNQEAVVELNNAFRGEQTCGRPAGRAFLLLATARTYMEKAMTLMNELYIMNAEVKETNSERAISLASSYNLDMTERMEDNNE